MPKIPAITSILIITRTIMAKAMENKPKVIVFDLDYTLWPFWVDTHVNPPFRKSSNGSIFDSSGATIKIYPESEQVLSHLSKLGYVLAVASRTGEIKGAEQLIELLGWHRYFQHNEIYPGSKITHLSNIRKKYGVHFNEIIFFDDEGRNIRDTKELGVFAVMVRNGITMQLVNDSLVEFGRSQKNASEDV